MATDSMTGSIRRPIAPWRSVRNGARAVEFYKEAFGATEVLRLEAPDGGVVARLSVDGAEFCTGDESPKHLNFSPRVSRKQFAADDLHSCRSGRRFCANGFGRCSGDPPRKRGAWLARGTRCGSIRASLGDWPSDRRLGRDGNARRPHAGLRAKPSANSELSR
jgi:hypothetical protein